MFRSFAVWFLVATLGIVGAERFLDRTDGRTRTAPGVTGGVHSLDDGGGFPPPPPCGC